MKKEDIFTYIDHTLLTPIATWESIKKLCEEAITYNTASVCIGQTYVKRVHDKYQDLNICTVVGFPLGYNSSKSKIVEVKEALKDGANEIDMVINITDVKNKDFAKVEREIASLKNICQDKILKVIIETCYLTRDEKITLCQLVSSAGADYIKTSTGFGSAGAKMEDILLFKDHIKSGLKIKAAGGIRTREDLENFIKAGCSRIGTSSAIKILNNENTDNSY